MRSLFTHALKTVSVFNGMLIFTLVRSSTLTLAAEATSATDLPAPPRMQQTSLGVTRAGVPILALVAPDDFDLNTEKIRVLLVGGWDRKEPSAANVLARLHWFATHNEAEPYRADFAISAVPNVYPASPTPDKETRNAQASEISHERFPPGGGYYNSQTEAEAAYLWRWIGMHAPDLVVDIRQGKTLAWEIPASDDPLIQSLGKILKAEKVADENALISALLKSAPAETGLIPALRVTLPERPDPAWLGTLLSALRETKLGPSSARRELQRRIQRSPLEVLRELSTVYGQDLNQVQYIPALALIARLRLGALTADARELAAIERIVSPYYSGEKPVVAKSGSDLSGHLIFSELAKVTSGERRERYLELAKQAADLAFDSSGKPRASMPFHAEMSDALFMGGPILAQVGGLSGEERYREACLRHLDFMRKLVLRDDGLYRHSPLGETAWGRGNGFPALGLTLCVADYPADHPDRAKLIEYLTAHLDALLPLQDATGCWHQIIDHPESYRELTSTCMIGYALARGVREGWLAREDYPPAAEKAWLAVNSRVGQKGRLVDVCTGTGKFPTLRDYYDRPAILGTDARGGAMVMIFAAEMAMREAKRK